MLSVVSRFLKDNKEKLAQKAPAMKVFINQFMEMEGKVQQVIITGNRYQVRTSTLEKQIIKKEFVRMVAKLIAVLNASGYSVKGKSLPEMDFSVYVLNKLSAQKLVQTYLKVYGAVKKTRNLDYYGLSAEDMRDMQAYYKEFNTVRNAPVMKKKEVALTNKNLEKGVKDCILFLKKNIDQMMLIATEADSSLLSAYKAARRVLPRGQGRPSDAETAYRKSRERKIVN